MPAYTHPPRTGGGKNYDYWKYQIPIVGNLYRGQDERKFWDDYYKKYGKRPKYGGRTYAGYDKSAINEIVGTAFSVGKVAKAAYRFAR